MAIAPATDDSVEKKQEANLSVEDPRFLTLSVVGRIDELTARTFAAARLRVASTADAPPGPKSRVWLDSLVVGLASPAAP